MPPCRGGGCDTEAVRRQRRRTGSPGLTGVAALAVCGGALLAACSGSGSGSVGTTTTAASTSTAPTTTTSAAGSSSTSATTTTAQGTGTQNLVVTDTLRTQLVQAGAALNSLAPSDYTGLVAGTTYYAYDAATATYWAAAGLVPSEASQQAQVSVQDDGAYLLFQRTATGSWKAQSDGLGGVGGTPCPSDLPGAVVAVWGWAPGTCRPPQ